MQDRFRKVEEESIKLKNHKSELLLELRKFKHLEREYNNRTTDTIHEKTNLKGHFKKMIKSNQGNFDAYNQLLNTKDQLDEEVDAINDQMEALRFENKTLNSVT